MTQIQRKFPAMLKTPQPQHCKEKTEWAGFSPWKQSVENPHRVKENLLWERKIAFLNVACTIPYLWALQFLRTKSCPECDWGIIRC